MQSPASGVVAVDAVTTSPAVVVVLVVRVEVVVEISVVVFRAWKVARYRVPDTRTPAMMIEAASSA